MALTEVYVDPSIAGNVGSGTIGDPYSNTQHGLDTQARDAVNGDRFNIKDSADDVLAASLSLAAYGTPTANAPLIIQGYTAAQGDGGIGGISGNGANPIINSATLDFISFIDMHLHNSGLGTGVIRLDSYCNFINCEIDNGGTLVSVTNQCQIINCYLHNSNAVGVRVATGCQVIFNTFENDTNDFTRAIEFFGAGCIAIFNVISIDGSSDGVYVTNIQHQILLNSIYSSSGTGSGINLLAGADGCMVMNNILEGFSGVGGDGVSLASGGKLAIYGFNAFYNNTTNFSNSGELFIDLSANDQALVASPFINAAASDFRVNTAVQALAYPTANYPNLSVRSYLDIGALQREEPAAGATPVREGLFRRMW